MSEEVKNPEDNTEEKIRLAARELFIRNGFSNTTVRDVAKQADVNVALVNYYFRSKAKLFKSIFKETYEHFNQHLSPLIFEESITFEKQVRSIIDVMLDHLMDNPDLPYFIISELRSNPDALCAEEELEGQKKMDGVFLKQMQLGIAKGKIKNVDPSVLKLIFNSLLLFPIIVKPIVQANYKLDDPAYRALIQNYKTIVADMLFSYMKTDKSNY